MSAPHFSTQGSLFSTAALGASLFPDTDRYRLFALRIYPQLVKVRPQLEKAYSPEAGRPAIEPILLLGVSLLQYLDGVPDRQAVELLRYHAGWNFALNRQLGDPLFHPTTLSRFRDRLDEHELTPVGFQAILDGLVDAGLLRHRPHQRLDSTHVLGLVSKMSRVEAMRQSLRLALEELEPATVAGERPPPWAGWWERYVQSRLDYRANADTLNVRMTEAGVDAWGLLQWLQERPALAGGEQAQLLARVFAEQFILENQAPRARGKGELASDRVQNPHDPDATYAVKQRQGEAKAHVGYKVQVAESVVEEKLEKGEPTRNFVTGVVVQPAHHSDEAGAEQMAQVQADLRIEPPPVQYVDGAYVSAEKLVEAAAAGREIIGPVQSAPRRQPEAFTVEDFRVEVEKRQAVCPAGKLNDQCSRLDGEANRRAPQYRFEWNQTTCRECPLRDRCLGEGQKHRTVVVGEHHRALQARRLEQKTSAFQERMRHRNAIEGTQSELVRAHGLRRARYRGLGKVQLQAWFAAAACNVKRWLRRCVWEMGQVSSQLAARAETAVS